MFQGISQGEIYLKNRGQKRSQCPGVMVEGFSNQYMDNHNKVNIHNEVDKHNMTNKDNMVNKHSDVEKHFKPDKKLEDLEKEFNQVLAEYTKTSNLINQEIIKKMQDPTLKQSDPNLLKLKAMWSKTGCSSLDILNDKQQIEDWKNFGDQATANDMREYCILTKAGIANDRQKKACGVVSKECSSSDEILQEGNLAYYNATKTALEQQNLVSMDLQSKIEMLSEKLTTISKNMVDEISSINIEDERLKQIMKEKKNNISKITEQLKESDKKIKQIRDGVHTIEGQLMESHLLSGVNYSEYLVWSLVILTLILTGVHFSRN